MLSEMTKIIIPVFLSMNHIYFNWIQLGRIHIMNIPCFYHTVEVFMDLACSAYKKSEHTIFLMVVKIDEEVSF